MSNIILNSLSTVIPILSFVIPAKAGIYCPVWVTFMDNSEGFSCCKMDPRLRGYDTKGVAMALRSAERHCE